MRLLFFRNYLKLHSYCWKARHRIINAFVVRFVALCFRAFYSLKIISLTPKKSFFCLFIEVKSFFKLQKLMKNVRYLHEKFTFPLDCVIISIYAKKVPVWFCHEHHLFMRLLSWLKWKLKNLVIILTVGPWILVPKESIKSKICRTMQVKVLY